MKESYEKLMMKLSLIQDNNILIPKDGKRQKPEEGKHMMMGGDDDYLSNL